MANEKGQAEGKDKKFITIVVNARPHQVEKSELSFAEVVALSSLTGGADTIFTVTYRRGEGHKPEGTLVEGQSVKVKEGMIFNVTATSKS